MDRRQPSTAGAASILNDGNFDITGNNLGSGAVAVVNRSGATLSLSGSNATTITIDNLDNQAGATTIINTGKTFVVAGSNDGNIVKNGLLRINGNRTFVNDGTITGTGTFSNFGTYAGTGSVAGQFDSGNGSKVEPGNPSGCLTFTNNVNFISSTTINVEVGGITPCTEYDRIVVNGTATLSNTVVNVTFTPGANFFQNDRIVLIDAGTLSGTLNNNLNTSNIPGLGTEWQIEVDEARDELVLINIGSNIQNAAPTAVCQPVTIAADANCEGTVVAAAFDGGSTDADGDQLTFTVSPAGPYAVGTTNVILTVSDGSLSSTCETTVTVEDNTAPLTPTLATVTVNCGATVPAPTTTDACAGTITGTTTDATSFTGEGTYAVTWNFDDGNGQSVDVVQTVTVADTEAPTFACPQATTLELNVCEGLTLTAELFGLSGTDNCGGEVTFAFSPATIASATTTDVTITASDASGNVTDGSCTVSVTTTSNTEAFTISAGADDLGEQCPGAAVTITVADLLANDAASNGAALEVQEIALTNAADGDLVDNEDGTYTFTPAAGVSGAVSLSYVVKTAGDDLFFADNGHFYEFVADAGITWENAQTAAANRNLNGQQGYLATVTSQGEQDFINKKLQGTGWMGASDVADEGVWRWVTGPETGQVFWQGDGDTGTSFNDAYSKWKINSNYPNEPNNEGIGEDYAHFRTDGTWNDWPNDVPGNSGTIQGYVVEYGSADCVPVQTATGSIVITLTDTEAPVVSCVSALTVNLDANRSAVLTAADLKNPNAPSTDNCGVPTLSIEAGDRTSFTCADLGQDFTVTLVATDAAGLTSTCDVIVTVADGNSNCNAAPTAVCQPLTIAADANCEGTVVAAAFDGGSTDADGDQLTFTVSPAGPYAVGTTNVILTVSDGSLSSTCETTVTVEDNTAPLTPTLATVTVNCGATVPAPTTTDACAGTITGTTTDATSFTGEGTYAVTWNFDDGNGQSVDVVQTVTVADTEAPTFACPQATTLELNVCEGLTLTAELFGLSGTDNCGGEVTFAFSPATIASATTTDVTITASDASGNVTDGSCTVSVTTTSNTEAFTISAGADDLGEQCPGAAVTITVADLLANDAASNGAALEVQEIALTNAADGDLVDNEDGTYTFIPAAGVSGAVSLSYVVKTAGDDLFFADNGHFYEFVADAGITWENAQTAAANRNLNGQQGYLATVTSQGEQDFINKKLQGTGWMGASDVADEGVWRWVTGPETGQVFWQGNGDTGTSFNDAYSKWKINSNYPNEPNNEGIGEDYAHFRTDGTWNDWPNDVPGNSGTIQGYVVEYGSADCVPVQTATGSIVITLTDTEAPVVSCVSALTVNLDANRSAVLTAADLKNPNAPSTDNCGVPTLSIETGDRTSFTCADLGQDFTVTLVATDAAGLTSTCDVIVTVADGNSNCNAAPTAVCQPLTIAADANCEGTVVAAAFDGGSTDADGDQLTFTVSPAGPYTVGTTNVILTVSDGSLSSTCETTVTVEDNTAPLTPTLATVTVNCGATVPAPTTTDACAGTITGTTTDATSFTGEGTYAVTWNFDDGNGQSVDVVQTVTVADTEAPTFACPQATTLELNVCEGLTLTAELFGLSGTDNCGGEVTFAFSPATIASATTTDVTITATDASGNVTDGSCTVSVTTTSNTEAFTISAGADDLGEQCPGAAVTITVADLLANDAASNGAALEVQEIALTNAADGDLVDNEDGTYTFIPAAGVSGAVSLSYVVKTAGDDLFFADNGHFYKYITAPHISWTDAKAAAEATILNGQRGYLVTVTSQGEQDFVNKRLEGFGWTGGREVPAGSNKWFWVTGPEGSNGGTQFSTGATSFNGAYVNWNPGEPNNNYFGTKEDYVHFYSDGRWNDYPVALVPGTPVPPKGFEKIDGYVVEFGSADCVPVQTAVGSITLTFDDNTAPLTPTLATVTVNCGATVPAPTTTDACAGTITGTTTDATSFTGEGTYAVTWNFDDGNGQSVDVVQTVTVADTEAPTFACPQATTLELNVCEGLTLTAELFGLSGTDNCGGEVTFAFSPATIASATTTDVTITASDASGNVTDGSCTVSVTTTSNTEAFTISAGADDLGEQCPGAAVTITVADLLANDAASNGAALEVQEIALTNAADGDLVDNEDGTYTFTPAAGVSGAVSLSYVVKTAGDDLFFADNGHFYEFVADAGITWENAQTAAANRNLNGQQGYLATVTSQGEQDFINKKLQGTGWMGASDVADEGVWRWVTGPETGQVFWQGDGDTGTSFNNAYSKWKINSNYPNEPNNEGIGEDYAHFRTDGTWNDWPNDVPGNSGTIQGYVVEYGSADCVPVQTATGSIVITLTDTEAPVVSCVSALTVNLDANRSAVLTAADLKNPNAPSTDNCGVPTLSIETGDRTSFTCADLGQDFTVTLVATDAAGLTSTCDVIVTVADGDSNCNAAPTAVCQPVTIAADANCEGMVVAAAFDGGSTDADGDVLTFAVSPAGPYTVGTTNVTLTVSDGSLSSTCETTVTVTADDFDNDGVCDAKDRDDDNDGILDEVECSGGAEITLEFNGTFGDIPEATTGDPDNNHRNYVSGGITVSGYSYNKVFLNEGNYAITNFHGAAALHGGFLWSTLRGHTTGSDEDAYLAVNGRNSEGVFYRESVTLQANTSYEFGVWAANANSSGSGAPEIGVRLLDNNGNLLVSMSSGAMSASGSPWNEVVATHNTGANTEFTLEVYNISLSGGGNDFAIDDVFFRTEAVAGCNADSDLADNNVDYDSDGDGCDDVVEAGYADGDGDGQLGTGTPMVNANGLVIGHAYVTPNGDFLDANISANCALIARNDTISYGRGYNIISFDVQPEGEAARISAVMGGANSGKFYFIVKRLSTGAIQYYVPSLPQYSTDFYVTPGEGFELYAFSANTVIVTGLPVDPATRRAIPSRRYTYVGYVPQAATLPAFYFDAINGFYFAQERRGSLTNGQFRNYVPRLPAYNTLPIVENGWGYLVYAFQATGEGGWLKGSGGAAVESAATVLGNSASNTYNAVFGDASQLPEGSQIDVVDGEGNLWERLEVGPNGHIMITPVFGYDELSGAFPDRLIGETLFFEYEGTRSVSSFVFDGSHALEPVNLEFTKTTATGELENGFGIDVYPNPFRDEVNITIKTELTFQTEDLDIQLMDVTGRTISQSTVNVASTSGTQTFSIPTGTLPAGSYLVKITADGLPLLNEIIQKVE